MRVAIPLLLCLLACAWVWADGELPSPPSDAAATVAATDGQAAPRITINVQGDRVEYDRELGAIAVQGEVRITARTDRPGYPTVSLQAGQVEGNVRDGVLIAHTGVKLLSQQFALRGEQARLNFKTAEFVLEHGAAEVDLPSRQYPGSVIRGYLFGETLRSKGEIVYVIEGRVTTCDRARPHYSIGAGKVTFNTRTQMMVIEHGHIQLYGLSLGAPTLNFQVGSTAAGQGVIPMGLPLPAYGSYDGLYFPFVHTFTQPEAEWQVTAAARLGSRLKLPGEIRISRAGDRDDLAVTVSRREEVFWDINQRSRVNRLPELRYVRHLQATPEGLATLDVALFGGYLQERSNLLPTSTDAVRWGVSLRYSPRPAQRLSRRGWWWGLQADQSFYDTGEALTDLGMELGVGTNLGDRTNVSLRGVHHETSGRSAFLFDDIHIHDAVQATFDTRVTDNYTIGASGLYDFDHQSLRGYTVWLKRRMHCLTWGVRYDVSQQSFGVSLDINGLTGDTRPADTAPLVLPSEVPPLPEPIPALPPAARTGPVAPVPIITPR